MALISPRRSLLSYPAGTAPGVDPSHPAAEALRFSGIASGGNFISLTQGRTGTISGSPTFGIDGTISRRFGVAATGDQTSFSSQPTTNDLGITCAAFVTLTALTGNAKTFFASSSANSGWRMGVNASGSIYVVAGGVAQATGANATMVAGAPYFIAISINGTEAHFLTLNLSNGQIRIENSLTGLTPVAPNGTYLVGNDVFNEGFNGNIAAVMFSATFMTLPELRAWAQDPWPFWYPNKAVNLTDGGTPTPPISAVVYYLMNVG